MEVKTAIYSPYLLIIIAVWATNCVAAPPKVANPNEKMAIPISTTLANSGGFSRNGKDHVKITSATTVDPFINNKGLKGTPPSAANTMTPRNKRGITESQGHLGIFPEARNADDALQKLLLLLQMTKPINTLGAEDYDEEIDNPAIDLVLGKEPGISFKGFRPLPQNRQSAKGEEPTGVPIVLYQHRMNKKSSPGGQGISELFLKNVARSGYELDPRVIKVLERVFRQSRAYNKDVFLN